MKYKISFTFSVVKFTKKDGICFQGLKGDTEAASAEPLYLHDPEAVELLTGIIVADLLTQGHNVIRNMFRIESITPA